VSINDHDVQRAADRAEVLAKLGRPVLPVVAGKKIDAEAITLARDRAVWQVGDGQTIPPNRRLEVVWRAGFFAGPPLLLSSDYPPVMRST
jgi:hypothetical protein